MAATHISLPAIENAIRDVCFALDENDHQSPSWAKMTEDNLLWSSKNGHIILSRFAA